MVAKSPESKPSTIAQSGEAQKLPLLVSAAIYTAISALIFARSYLACDHHLIYPLDDPYITMAMARSFAAHGIWGITRFGFTSSSSTPLFTLIVALCYRVLGVNLWIPAALSWIFGLACLVPANSLAKRYLPADRRILALAVFTVATPLYVVGVVGMENSLHLFLMLLFLDRFATADQYPVCLTILSACMVVTRYESLFFLFASLVAFALRRQWRAVAATIIGAGTAVCTYGAYSLQHGGYFLPNSVLLKGLEHGGINMTVISLVSTWLDGRHLILLLAALAVAGWHLRRIDRDLARLIAVVFTTGVIHLLAARVGNAFRYEAYIVGCAVLALIFAFQWIGSLNRGARAALITISTLAALSLLIRAASAATALPKYSRAVYLQQWQSAQFLRQYFPTATIAANDIGAISYLTDIRCIDLVGLADLQVFEAKHSATYTSAFLQSHVEANGASIAIVYDRWFTGASLVYLQGPKIPAQWVKVARLITPKSDNLGDHVVSFYATRSDQAATLRDALHKFNSSLPAPDQLVFEN